MLNINQPPSIMANAQCMYLTASILFHSQKLQPNVSTEDLIKELHTTICKQENGNKPVKGR